MKIFCTKKDLCTILGRSPSYIDSLISRGILVYDIHFNKWTNEGDNMFYLPQIIKDLKPDRATEVAYVDGGQGEKEAAIHKISLAK